MKDFTALMEAHKKTTPNTLEIIEANRVCTEVDGDLMIVAEFYDHCDEDGNNAEFFVLAHSHIPSLVEELERRRWQPIEIAPMDVPILMAWADGHIQIAAKNKEMFFYPETPTHWQPLPAPPEEQPK